MTSSPPSSTATRPCPTIALLPYAPYRRHQLTTWHGSSQASEALNSRADRSSAWPSRVRSCVSLQSSSSTRPRQHSTYPRRDSNRPMTTHDHIMPSSSSPRQHSTYPRRDSKNCGLGCHPRLGTAPSERPALDSLRGQAESEHIVQSAIDTMIAQSSMTVVLIAHR